MKTLAIMLALLVSLLLVQTAVTDLITIRGFEIGDFTGWFLKGNADLFTSVDNESHVHSDAAAIGSVGTLSFFGQTLPVTTDITDELEFWLYSGGRTLNDCFAAWGTASIYVHPQNLTSATYQKIRTNFAFSGADTNLFVGFDDTIGSLYLDNVFH